MIGGWTISSVIVLKWMSLALIDDKSTLFQVVDWCPQLWLGTASKQAIAWANVGPDLCGHMESLDHKDLTNLLCVFCVCTLIPVSFTQILQSDFTSIGTAICLSRCQWSNIKNLDKVCDTNSTQHLWSGAPRTHLPYPILTQKIKHN